MKKFIIMVLAVMLTLALAACGKSGSEEPWTEQKAVDGAEVTVMHFENGLTATFGETEVIFRD